ncbi:aminoacyl-histidine dipeptidase [Paludibacter sp.]
MINLHPKILWNYFHKITQIPRPSSKEGKITDFLIEFAKSKELEYSVDKAGNLLIRKEGTSGKEHHSTVILQAHMDMVCEKNADIQHDFENDPIQTYIEDDWVKAKGTTLGADNGIGMAMMLSVLDSSDVSHPPLECLFTVEEETGLVGAYGLDSNFLKGTRLINLDSEDDGEIFIGCAGGIGTKSLFSFEKEKIPSGFMRFNVSVSGLSGGHSGGDIHLGKANAIKVLNRYLWLLKDTMDLRLISFEGGNLHNAIPREAKASFVIPHEEKENIRIILNVFISVIEEEYQGVETNFKMKLESESAFDNSMSKQDSDRLINMLYALPHGVVGMSRDMADLVETSTNLASVKIIDSNNIEINTSQRSSVESQKENISAQVKSVFELAGTKVAQTDGYPGWKPNLKSELLRKAEIAYKAKFSEEPRIRAIHAGLECGLFLSKYPNLDMISIGPQMHGVHSPDERLSIKSTQKSWEWLKEILKNC